ncbi:molybdopterin-binding protein [Anoxybacter fermentans]|uniref:Molybdopterin molybdenumtransferase n=1 Tax=Anoxybacter fermentans TaxID=1323375 RepID=A0A3Q9HS87_9FIRM|nr:molybdopterin-binding protein [Anoxybacter fermentans]AZR74586.1 molybdopterin-binding protein [Anoxybacter fermentans]
MKKVPVEEAVGMVLGHDMTQIIPGLFKGPRFKKGHVIREEDIPILKSMGKDHIYILELKEGMLHENDAAIRIARATAGEGIKLTEPSEGKVNYIAEYPGMLEIDVERLHKINGIDGIGLITLHTGRIIQEGQIVAGTRVNPLVIEEVRIKQVEEVASQGDKLLKILPFKQLKVGIVITGNEVYYGRIQDKFGPVLKEKLNKYGANLFDLVYVPDDANEITTAILSLKEAGADVVVTGGGMSVDPDDVTPLGIRQTGAEVIKYGAPVLPGSMFMMAYLDEMPIIGLPACAMYHKITVFDLIFPKVLVGRKVKREDIVRLGHGGLCMHCEICHYPVCPLGKG